MLEAAPRSQNLRFLARALTLLVMAAPLGGCQTAHYYSQAIRGEYAILHQRQPIAKLLAAPDTTPELKSKFELIQRLRAFAKSDLKLPIDHHYETYVDLGRRYAVWNVHAAPEFSLHPKKWWYPFVGSLKYRGYFSEPDARGYADQLAKTGEEVYVEGVEAYSTLGWFADPVLNTFIRHQAVELTEIIFHELAHQRLFLSGDTDLNEAFATVVAEEGVRRWYAAAQDEPAFQRYAADLERNRQFVALVMDARAKLALLYGDDVKTPASQRPGRLDPNGVRQEKQRIISQMRADFQKLRSTWHGESGYDRWFSRSLNNAQLNTIALYYQLVPGLKALLQAENGDLERFYNRVQALHKMSKEKRRLYLLQLGQGNP